MRYILDLIAREKRLRRHVEALNPKTDPAYPDAFAELTAVQARLREFEEVEWHGDGYRLRT